MKQYFLRMIILSAVLGASVLIVLLSDLSEPSTRTIDHENGLINQNILVRSDQSVEITKVYLKDKLLGFVKDKTRLYAMLEEFYENQYADKYPTSSLSFSDDVYFVEEISFSIYENNDDQLFEFLVNNGEIALSANRVEFSNGAIIYVANLEDFETAKEEFVRGYVPTDVYEKIRSKEPIDKLTEYGESIVGFDVLETTSITQGFANVDDILENHDRVLDFLSFGYTPNIQTYVSNEYDTVRGIAWQNSMSPNQLLFLNEDIINSVDQIITEGMVFKVARFNSPLTVKVTKDRFVSEELYPDEPIYLDDPTLREGLMRVEQNEEKGYADVYYRDTLQNDIVIESTELSNQVIKNPKRQIVYVGTYVEPKVGSGNFRWPMNNAQMTCGWYCYDNHRAVDIQARSNRGYGPIYAVDRGVVEANAYDSTRGYYVVINHNNGYKSEYLHMEGPAYFPVGTTVKSGEQIGYVGMTGRTTGPHVHLVIQQNNVPINPCRVIAC